MRYRYFALGFMSVSNACSRQQLATIPLSTPIAVVPLQVTDYKSDGRLGDRARGDAYVYDTMIRIVIREGVLSFKSSLSERLTAVSAALVYGDTARWNVRSQSPKVYVRGIRTRGDTLADSLVFIVPRPRDADLNQHWISLIEYASLTIPNRPSPVEGTRPIHGVPGMFRGVPSH